MRLLSYYQAMSKSIKIFLLAAVLVALGIFGYTVLGNRDQNNTGMSESELAKAFDMDGKAEGTKLYYSDRLGIGFTYIPEPDLAPGYTVSVVEDGNKIVVDEEQSVEVFSKNPEQTLEEAIAERFLKGYDPKKCFVKIYDENIEVDASGYVAAGISFPEPENPEDAWWTNNVDCPNGYSEINGVSYFLMNKEVPGKFVFVEVGQYAAASDGIVDANGQEYNWSHSIRILK